jgi:hypothetical protein
LAIDQLAKLCWVMVISWHRKLARNRTTTLAKVICLAPPTLDLIKKFPEPFQGLNAADFRIQKLVFQFFKLSLVNPSKHSKLPINLFAILSLGLFEDPQLRLEFVRYPNDANFLIHLALAVSDLTVNLRPFSPTIRLLITKNLLLLADFFLLVFLTHFLVIPCHIIGIGPVYIQASPIGQDLIEKTEPVGGFTLFLIGKVFVAENFGGCHGFQVDIW